MSYSMQCPECKLEWIPLDKVSPEFKFNLLKAENARLREALGSLLNEASGLLRVHEFALSMDGGNSNIQVLRLRLEEARAALEGNE